MIIVFVFCDSEAFDKGDEIKNCRDIYESATKNADLVHFNPDVDIKALEDVLNFTRNSVQRKLMFKNMMEASIYVQRVSYYFDLMAKLTYV